MAEAKNRARTRADQAEHPHTDGKHVTVLVRGKRYKWLAMAEIEEHLESEEFWPALQENISHHLKIPIERQILSDNLGMVLGHADLIRFMKHPEPCLWVYDGKELKASEQAEVRKRLQELYSEIMRIFRLLGGPTLGTPPAEAPSMTGGTTKNLGQFGYLGFASLPPDQQWSAPIPTGSPSMGSPDATGILDSSAGAMSMRLPQSQMSPPEQMMQQQLSTQQRMQQLQGQPLIWQPPSQTQWQPPQEPFAQVQTMGQLNMQQALLQQQQLETQQRVFADMQQQEQLHELERRRQADEQQHFAHEAQLERTVHEMQRNQQLERQQIEQLQASRIASSPVGMACTPGGGFVGYGAGCGGGACGSTALPGGGCGASPTKSVHFYDGACGSMAMPNGAPATSFMSAPHDFDYANNSFAGFTGPAPWSSGSVPVQSAAWGPAAPLVSMPPARPWSPGAAPIHTMHPHQPTTDDPELWAVTLEKGPDAEFGFAGVPCTDNKEVLITWVDPQGCLARAWNSVYPNHALRPGDWIVAVNSHTENAELLLQQLKFAPVVQMLVRRNGTRPPPSQYLGAAASYTVQAPPTYTYSRSTYPLPGATYVQEPLAAQSQFHR